MKLMKKKGQTSIEYILVVVFALGASSFLLTKASQAWGTPLLNAIADVEIPSFDFPDL
jgi:uncharacterized protein (UPF0333 family)